VVGEQLEDLLVREGAMQAPRAVALMAQICDAVHDAHIHGIIHRDLKLANVIVMKRHDEEEPKVLDFGIARLADEASTGNKSVTRRGIVVGTPEYLSPEQALGQPIDARADIYSLGIMIYTLLAGRLPFFSENLRLVVTMQLTQPPPPLTDSVPRCSRPWRRRGTGASRRPPSLARRSATVCAERARPRSWRQRRHRSRSSQTFRRSPPRPRAPTRSPPVRVAGSGS
jgi:serine/threonine-protein kinase